MRFILALMFGVATLLAGGNAAARVERFAVVIGNNRGLPQEIELRYAERDASRIADVMVDVGGFPTENVVRLLGGNAASVRRVLVGINDRVRSAVSDGAQVMLVVYYSGHADSNTFHLGASSLEIDELTKIVRGSAATFRMLIVDSCRSGAVLRKKGARPAPEFAINVEEKLAGQGLAVMTATAADEDAQESDELGASFFTHFLVSGLLGAADSDDDGTVDVPEAYRYAYEETLRETSRTLAGTQHPSFRYDLAGLDAIVLTTPGRNSSRRGGLRLPAGRSYLVFRGAAGTVVAEVGAHNRHRRLNLEAGVYFVRGRGDKDLVEGSVSVVAGSEREVDDSKLTRSAYARLVRKGFASSGAIWGALAGVTTRSDLYGGTALCPGAELGVRLDVRALALAARLGACQSRFEAPPLVARNREFRIGLSARRVWDVGPIAIDVGVAGGMAVLHQAFTTRGQAPARAALAFDFGVVGGLEWPSDARVALAVDVLAGTVLFRRRNQADDPTTIATEFVLRGGVGAIWRF